MRLKAAFDKTTCPRWDCSKEPETAPVLGAPTGGTFMGISCLSGRARGHVIWCAFNTFPFLVSLTTYRQNQDAYKGGASCAVASLQHESVFGECSGSSTA